MQLTIHSESSDIRTLMQVPLIRAYGLGIISDEKTDTVTEGVAIIGETSFFISSEKVTFDAENYLGGGIIGIWIDTTTQKCTLERRSKIDVIAESGIFIPLED